MNLKGEIIVETIKRFLDDEGKIKIWPKKKELKIEILKYLSTKFEYDKNYVEKEVNVIIEKWHTFNDFFLLRRGMIDYKFLCRTRDGSNYWRNREE
ncbi:DUF2087 domain-containing protein [Clostridium saccharoperbutylacetonicum]|jgi:hypothetical protein|uniref:DUF2087 domain-containing protein n=1 Tax=Clostridium saccharoperbutylacetonicum TaxID=36745 RepID=UPI000983D373|nr:DUF2087 domain-containing protein [Clostridium saccharoperbutylacetonicum]AQR96049.1 hypothetical protein CLSAP_33670 [Clostridium saccharoperbutylacetonicum]NSB31918.1 hypothetical protein [Clostridium saccharoperbutylacetonicum]